MTPWTIVIQAPLPMGFPRQEYWSGLPFSSPGDLPNPRIEPGSPALQTDSLPSEPPGKPMITLEEGKNQTSAQKTAKKFWIFFLFNDLSASLKISFLIHCTDIKIHFIFYECA